MDGWTIQSSIAGRPLHCDLSISHTILSNNINNSVPHASTSENHGLQDTGHGDTAPLSAGPCCLLSPQPAVTQLVAASKWLLLNGGAVKEEEEESQTALWLVNEPRSPPVIGRPEQGENILLVEQNSFRSAVSTLHWNRKLAEKCLKEFFWQCCVLCSVWLWFSLLLGCRFSLLFCYALFSIKGFLQFLVKSDRTSNKVIHVVCVDVMLTIVYANVANRPPTPRLSHFVCLLLPKLIPIQTPITWSQVTTEQQ